MFILFKISSFGLLPTLVTAFKWKYVGAVALFSYVLFGVY
jgi:hypothetical protein